MAQALQDASLRPTSRKHLIQNASLVAHLQKIGAFKTEIGDENDQTTASPANETSDNYSSNSCFIEFGAGRGTDVICIHAC